MGNSQSAALITASRLQGWDPTVIGGDFDVPRDSIKNPAGTGRLPQGIPDSFPEDHPAIAVNATPFATPKVRVDGQGRTTNADPDPGN